MVTVAICSGVGMSVVLATIIISSEPVKNLTLVVHFLSLTEKGSEVSVLIMAIVPAMGSSVLETVSNVMRVGVSATISMDPNATKVSLVNGVHYFVVGGKIFVDGSSLTLYELSRIVILTITNSDVQPSFVVTAMLVVVEPQTGVLICHNTVDVGSFTGKENVTLVGVPDVDMDMVAGMDATTYGIILGARTVPKVEVTRVAVMLVEVPIAVVGSALNAGVAKPKINHDY